MAAMAAAIFGSIFNEIENRALGPADRAVERGGVVGRSARTTIVSPLPSARPALTGSGGKRGAIAGRVRDHLMLPPIQIAD